MQMYSFEQLQITLKSPRQYLITKYIRYMRKQNWMKVTEGEGGWVGE